MPVAFRKAIFSWKLVSKDEVAGPPKVGRIYDSNPYNTNRWRGRLVAYGARLESVLGASPRGFESLSLRHFLTFLQPFYLEPRSCSGVNYTKRNKEVCLLSRAHLLYNS